MAEVIGKRIEARMRDLGLSQSALARATGMKLPSIGRLISGETRRTNHLVEIAQALRTTPDFLTGVSDSPDKLADLRHQFGEFPRDDVASSDVVEIRELDLTFGFGATYLDIPVTETMRPFGREFIRQHTRARPEELFFAQGIGDSMFPTLLDSDVLLIDTSQKVVNIAAKVWAVSYGGMGMVKRISPAKGGGVMLHSDNTAIPEQIAYDEELQVLGRLVAYFRKM